MHSLSPAQTKELSLPGKRQDARIGSARCNKPVGSQIICELQCAGSQPGNHDLTWRIKGDAANAEKVIGVGVIRDLSSAALIGFRTSELDIVEEPQIDHVLSEHLDVDDQRIHIAGIKRKKRSVKLI